MLRHKCLALLCLIVMVTGCTSCGGGSGTTPVTPQVGDFNAERAFLDLEHQCSFGARTPGSTAHSQCLAWLETQFAGADPLVKQAFSSETPFGGPYDFTNVLALYGADKPGTPFLICAHWDSRPKADADPLVANRDRPVMGANDGASGVAVILELARLMKDVAPPRPVVLALLDAEDSGKDGNTSNVYEGFCIGTVYLADHWPSNVPKPAEGALLDMVGRATKTNTRLGVSALFLPIEGNSVQANATLVNALWTLAEQRGHTAFSRHVSGMIIDDHLPLIAAGIKCIDLIQAPFPPEWHTVDDTAEYCSATALNQTGDTLLRYLYGTD
jgi:glutaminyl-peptide cyclotransferase